MRLTALIKLRSYSRSNEELWLHEYSSPLAKKVFINSDAEHRDFVRREMATSSQEYVGHISHNCVLLRARTRAYYVDKCTSGWLVWDPRGIKAYKHVSEGDVPIQWESASGPAVRVIEEAVNVEYVAALMDIYGQESARASAKPDIRADHVNFTKSLGLSYSPRRYVLVVLSSRIAKTLQGAEILKTFPAVETMLFEADRFKQRAGYEFLAGVTRGISYLQTLLLPLSKISIQAPSIGRSNIVTLYGPGRLNFTLSYMLKSSPIPSLSSSPAYL